MAMEDDALSEHSLAHAGSRPFRPDEVDVGRSDGLSDQTDGVEVGVCRQSLDPEVNVAARASTGASEAAKKQNPAGVELLDQRSGRHAGLR
jgi:hypothetical protein